MKDRSRVVAMSATIASAAATLCALLLLAPEPARAQAPTDDRAQAAKAALVKATFEASARVLTLYDRQGKVVRTIGDPAVYRWPALSSDGTRLAVGKLDQTTGNADIWVFDLSTGASTKITSDPAGENELVWSPDGRQIAYTVTNLGYGSVGLYRKNADGTGTAELLYKHLARPNDSDNFNAFVTDWSSDGRFLTFNDNKGRMYVLPLNAVGGASSGPGERKAIEVASQFRAGLGRLSPDGRFLSYASDQSGKWEVYVQPFDAAAGDGATPAAGPWQISDQGGWCTCAWRQDGKEFYYLTPDGGVMTVEVTTTPMFKSGKPRLLFNVPASDLQDPGSADSFSPDGQQFLFAIPPKRRGAGFPRQTTVFDRQGKMLRTLGEPRYTEPRLSPDGTTVAAFLNNDTLWVFDVSTGKGTQIRTSGHELRYQLSPVWSPDGTQIAFFSYREASGRIYRIASDGTGKEEPLFSHAPGVYAPPNTDWSPDGRFLTYSENGVPSWFSVNGEGKAVELLREEYNVYGVRFSPDSRFVAYVSDESGRNEVYVRPFDPSSGLGNAKWQVSKEGGLGLVQWRRDGRELYYLAPDGGVMAVDLATTASAFQSGKPKLLFRVPPAFPLTGVFEREGTNAPECSNNGLPNCEQGSISRDGQRFVFNVPQPSQRSEVTVAPAILAKYVGTYTESTGIEWTVTLENNQLMIQRIGRQKVPLFAESETKFFLRLVNGDFEFVKDDKGDVICLFLYRGGPPTQLIRK